MKKQYMRVDSLRKNLNDGKLILMDGAMGTEINRRGFSTSMPLWSSEVLLSNPEIVQVIHEDYIKAGSQIIITNTFSTTKRVFKKQAIENQVDYAVGVACAMARQAVDNQVSKGQVWVAGSISPLEDCYSPKLTPSRRECEKEHLESALNLKKGKVDFVLLETMITKRESITALQAVKFVDMPVAICFCCNDRLELLSGESLEEMVRIAEKFEPLFIGINCISVEVATKTVPFLRRYTDLPICVYAQGDGVPDRLQGWKFLQKNSEDDYVDFCKKWIEHGVNIVGGCCGTTPDYVSKLSEKLSIDNRIR